MKTVAILVGLMHLTACVALPKRGELPSMKSFAEYRSEQAFSAPAGQWPSDAWWKAYGDPQLDALIDEALAGTPSVAVADARLRRARAFSDVAASANRPQLDATATATGQKQSENFLSPSQLTPQGWNDYGRATLDLSWDLDLWGRQRAALAAAISEAEAARADAAEARLAISTAIASAYAEFARENAALDTAMAARAVRGKTAELFRHRFDSGLETLGSVRQVESREALADAEVLSIEEQLAIQRNQLAALAGAGPDRGLALERPSVPLARMFTLPERLAAELVGRRPDLAAARLRAEAASARIGEAQAAFYPNVNLTAFIGWQSLGLDMLTREGSGIGSVGPAVTLPIFNGGRLRGQLRARDAEYSEAVAAYDRTLVQALQEIADVAVSQRALGPQITRTDEAVTAAREAWRVQSDRYNGGLSTYLEVLSAEDSLLSTLRTQTDLQHRSLMLDVALIRALGGGYSTTSF